MISLRPAYIATSISLREIEPAVMAGDDPVRSVQAVSGFLRRPTQAAQEVTPFACRSVAVHAEDRKEGRMHDKQLAVMISEPLYGIEPAREKRRFICVPIA